MMVTLASAGPLTQSVLLTAGKTDSAVGPGVGFLLMTVQPESGSKLVSVGTLNTTVGAGRATLVTVVVGVACALGKQPVRVSEATNNAIMINLRIHFSINKILEQFYQRKPESGRSPTYTHSSLILTSAGVGCGTLLACGREYLSS
jgi:hypothetical protein